VKFWWVNQGKTFTQEVQAGYLWSPKVDRNGAFNYSYQTMTLVEPGDLIFSYADSQIKAAGIAQRKSYLGPKPDFGLQGTNWNQSGWYVDVEFQLLQNAPRPRDFIEELIPFLPEKYSPILSTGKGNQKVYLVDISEELAFILIKHAGISIRSIQEKLSPVINSKSEYEINLEIASRGVQGNLEQEQLIMARRGQGVFRHNVRLVEKRCRLTYLEDSRHLIASHIKPWKVSQGEEKISQNNGLLLSPHVDHLFDGGLITFENSGKLLVSDSLERNVLEKWKLTNNFEPTVLNSEQQYFMQYHRDFVFKPDASFQ
jgi:putative restriction endonuclease